jgi:hypothetical protein
VCGGGTLGEHPCEDKLWRAVERTYVRPAASQERAAAALGLPFSTYRRHLTQGVDASWPGCGPGGLRTTEHR